MAGLDEQLDISMLDNAIIDQLGAVNPKIEEPIIKEVKTSDTVEVKEGVKEEKKGITKEEVDKVVDVLTDIETETSEEKDKSNAEDPPATSVYPALAEFLKERGVISSLDDVSTIKTEDDFVKVVQDEIEASKYANLTDKQVMYMKAMEAGVNEELVQNTISIIDNLGAIEDKDIQEDAELRAELIREDLKAQGWEDVRISKQIERLVKSGDDVEEALHSKTNIVALHKENLELEQQEKVQAQKDAKQAELDQLKKLKDEVYNMDNALGSIKVDGALKDKIYNAMTTVTETTKDGIPINALTADRLKDPVDFDKRLYSVYVLTNGFKDISSLQRKAENKAARNLREAVLNTGVEISSSGTGLFKPDLNDMPDIVKLAD